MDKADKKLLGTAWVAGDASCLLIVPKHLAKQYGIDEPSNVIIEGRPEGILIRKVQLLKSDILAGSMKEETSTIHETREYTVKKSLQSAQVRGRGEIAVVGADEIRL